MKQLEEMIDGRKVTILVPEDETEQDRLEDMIFEQVRRGGDAKQYDAFHESHGRFVLSTTEESRYFSVRLNENGDPVVHEDD